MDLPESSATPSTAFAQAQQQLRAFCDFSRGIQQLSERMRRDIQSSLPWTIEKPGNDPVNHFWVRAGVMRGYAKLLQKNNCDILPHPLETEKLVTDIGYDIGLPVAPTAFATLETSHGPAQALVSAVQFGNPNTLYNTATRNRPDLQELPTILQSFFREQPHLTAAFMALSVFDIWTRNNDRQGLNIAVGKPDGLSGLYSALSGFDHQIRAEPTLHPYIKQGVFLKDLDGNYALQGASAALTAIENYPAQRIRAASQRLAGISNYPALYGNRYAEELIARQACLRTILPSYLSPRIIERLPPAA